MRLRHSPEMTAEASDADLLDRVKRRDQAAFRQLYQRHSSVVFAVALRLLGGNHADAEDALQETWLRAVRGLSGFRGESALRTWLTGIAIRVALEIGRSRQTATPVHADEPSPANTPELAVDLERLIHDLPHGYRHVLVLHDIEGHTHEEIARLLNIETGTSKSQLSRARGLLRRWWSRPAEELRHGR